MKVLNLICKSPSVCFSEGSLSLWLRPQIFISYRRSDSPYVAQSIYERLVEHFGEAAVFFAVREIPPGVDFPSYLREDLGQCQVLLAIIGATWLDVTDSQGNRRIDRPQDWVRQEIERGLAHPSMRVIPVLVNNASQPSAETLPISFQPLVYRNAHMVRPGRDFAKDLDWLIEDLERVLHQSPAPEKPLPPNALSSPSQIQSQSSPSANRSILIFVSLLVGFVLAVVVGFLLRQNPLPTPLPRAPEPRIERQPGS